MFANVLNCKECGQVIGKKYESVENTISGRRTGIMHC